MIKYATGEVKDLIKNYIQFPAKDGYEATKNQLYHLYRDPHRVIAAYWKEIKHWSQVKHGDADGYRRFLNFLLKCETITQMQTWNVLDTPEVMCMLLSKLPSGTRDKWSRKVLGIRRKLKRDPELADLIDFVSDENLIVNDPVFSKEAVEQYIEKKPVKCGKKLSTYVGGSTECHVLDHGDKIVKCINCAANHLLDNCPSFLEKTLRERISFLAKNKFCCACFQPMKQGHNVKTCDQRLSCRSCKGNHPTAMHGYISKDKLRLDNSTGQNGDKKIANNFAVVTVATTQENSDTEIIIMCIVPVKIRHWKNIKNEVLTYAMLDSCSQGSFIQEDLIKELQLSGRKTTLNLKTMNGERTESNVLIEGMDVKGVSGNNS